MAITFNNNFKIGIGAPIDSKYLNNLNQPYTNISAVNGAIPESQRYVGLTVLINSGATNIEYWYEVGVTDSDLKLKTVSGGGTITGATNGLTISGKNVRLGGNLTGSTVFTDLRGTPSGLQYANDYSVTYTVRSLVDKGYVDSIASGLVPKAAVVVATTSPIVLSGLSTVDGIPLTTGMRVLVKNQGGLSPNVNNGIYSASTGTWGRTADFDGSPSGETVSGNYMWVLSGNTNAQTSWVLITPDPITIGVTPIQFVLFNHVQDVTAGTGITITTVTGNHIISLDVPTQNIVNSAITGVTNGLTKVGLHGACLGGTLINPITCINVNTNALLICNATGVGVRINNTGTTLGDTNSVNSHINIDSSFIDICGQSSGVHIHSNDCVLLCTCTGSNGINLNAVNAGSFMIGCAGFPGAIYDSVGCVEGIKYANVTENWIGTTPRALPDVQWVTGYTLCSQSISAVAITGVTNGLTKIGSHCAKLGGTLTGATDISGTQDLSFGFITPLFTFGVVANSDIDILLTDNSAELSLSADNALLRSKCVYVGLTGGSGSSLFFTGTTVDICGNVKLSTIPTTGLSTDDILVWNSTDNFVKKISGGAVLTSAITGATNGLTKQGQIVVLGGNLTGATTINLCNNVLKLQSDNINVYGLADFGLNSTYACSKFGICSRDVINGSWGFSGNSSSISAYHCADGANGSCLNINNTGLTISNKTSSVSCTVTLGTNALVYGGCYHNCYVNRTLVDKEYVDKEVSGCSNMMKIRLYGQLSAPVLLTTDDVIAVSGTSIGQEICLPASPQLCCGRGQRIVVVDICGNALANPIIINGFGTPINGGTCSTINTDYGSVTFVYNGFFWSAIAFVN